MSRFGQFSLLWIDMAERMARILRSKAVRLKIAMGALAMAVLLTAIGLGVNWRSGGSYMEKETKPTHDVPDSEPEV